MIEILIQLFNKKLFYANNLDEIKDMCNITPDCSSATVFNKKVIII